MYIATYMLYVSDIANLSKVGSTCKNWTFKLWVLFNALRPVIAACILAKP